MKCPLCQHTNAAGAAFCNACGGRLGVNCAHCRENPPGAAFCNACGRRLGREAEAARAMLAGQRRRVAVLFADLSGSTALGEKFDAEIVFEVMNACFAGLAGIVERYEGTVLKYIGDAMMVLFGAPIAHGDDPQRAVLAALEMQQWLTDYSLRLEAERGVPFRMRIGINYGPVIAGGVGALGRMEYDVLGDAVNVAQRLEAAAEPGAVYVSEAVERLARGRVRFDAVGLVRVKGRGESVNVFRAVAPRDADESGPSFARTGALVGRDSEVELLAAAVQQSTAGQGRFLGLMGEPGIGKSMLVELATHLAREQGAQAYLLSGAEREVHDPFGSIRKWLHEALSGEPGDSIHAKLKSLAGTDGPAANYLEELTQLLDASAAPAGLDPETRRRLQVQGVCALAGSLAQRRPLFLALDDLQWMDPLTQEVARNLADRVLSGELPACCLLVAYRAGTPPEWIAEGYAEYVHSLAALDEPSCLELMNQWLRVDDLPREVATGIAARSGGHPHYLVELLRHLLETEALRLEDGRWQWRAETDLGRLPDTLYGAVSARLDRLQTSQMVAVQHGATVGQQFPVWLVRELEPALNWDENLHALEGMQFLTEQSPPPDWEMRFKQAVVRDVAYESLLLARRKELHGHIAGLLEARLPLRECASLLAWHYEFAESWREAARCHHEAGRQAAELYSNEDALQHQEACLSALAKAGTADPQAAFEARRALAAVAARLGEYERAAAEYETCLQWPDAGAESRADILGQLARCRHETGAVQQAADLWRRGLRCVAGLDEAGAHKVRAALLGEWGFAAYRSGRLRRALKLADWSYQAATEAGALLERGDAANLRGLAHQARGEMEAAIAAYRETQAIALETGDLAALATVRNNLGTLLFARGQLDEAQTAYEAALATWDRIGDRGQSATVLTNLGNLALARGQYPSAAAEFERAQKLFAAVNQPFGAAAAAAVLGEVLLEQDDVDAALTTLTSALNSANELDAPDLAAYARLGLAEAALRQADTTTTLTHLDAAHTLIEEFDIAGLRGQEWRIRGKYLLASANPAAGVTLLLQALDHFEEMEMRQEAARTLVLLAAASDGESAQIMLEHAREIFQEVGAEGDLERLIPRAVP